ncbi:MAG: hypothetical protein WCV81_04680 [Microgenomates group bacterium]|jgi:hypothetical protein
MKSKELLTRLACVGAAVVGPVILGGCAGNSKPSLEDSAGTVVPTPAVVQESPSLLKVRSYITTRAGNYFEDYEIYRVSPDTFLLISYVGSYSQMNAYTTPLALEYMRKVRGCEVSDVSAVSALNVKIKVKNPGVCLQELE